jgi:hypothetical protein
MLRSRLMQLLMRSMVVLRGYRQKYGIVNAQPQKQTRPFKNHQSLSAFDPMSPDVPHRMPTLEATPCGTTAAAAAGSLLRTSFDRRSSPQLYHRPGGTAWMSVGGPERENLLLSS